MRGAASRSGVVRDVRVSEEERELGAEFEDDGEAVAAAVVTEDEGTDAGTDAGLGSGEGVTTDAGAEVGADTGSAAMCATVSPEEEPIAPNIAIHR